MKRTKKAVICYICGQAGADSVDHVIPRCFFPAPRPSNLLTLPAHYSCHNRLAEEYVRSILAGLSASAPAQQLNVGAAARAIQRNDPMREAILRSMIPRADVRSPGGLFLGTAPAVRIDRSRFYPVMEKIVRGLYRHHTGRFLPPAAVLNWGLNELLFGGRETLFQASAAGLAYPGVFDCRYGVAAEGDVEMTIWWMRFYGSNVVRCLTRVG